MWIDVEVADLLDVGVGAVFGAIVAVALLRLPRTRFLLLAYDVAIGILVAAIVVANLRWSHASFLTATGFVCAAAPLTIAIPPQGWAGTPGSGLRRQAASIATHVLYGVAAGLAGFVAAYGVALAILGDII